MLHADGVLSRLWGGSGSLGAFAVRGVLFMLGDLAVHLGIDLALQIVPNGGLKGRHGFFIFDKVTQMTVFFLTYRSLQGYGLLGDFKDLPYFI